MNGGSTSVIALTILLLGRVASADPIIVVNTDGRLALTLTNLFSPATPIPERVVEARAGDRLVASDAAPPPTGFRTTSTATLTSSFADPLHWFARTATSTSVVGGGSANTFANVQFGAEFSVTEPVAYAFNGSGNVAGALKIPDTSSFQFVDSVAFGFLSEIIVPGEDPILRGVFGFEEFPFSLTADGSFAKAFDRQFAGILTPGQYTLQWAGGGGVGISNGTNADSGEATSASAFTLDFSPLPLSPTPEPASLLLLGSAIAGVFGVRSRRNHVG